MAATSGSDEGSRQRRRRRDEGFGSEDDWDEGEESLETDVEDGLDDPRRGRTTTPWATRARSGGVPGAPATRRRWCATTRRSRSRREAVERIVATCRRAPSAGYSQGQRLLVVTEAEGARTIAQS